MDTRRSKSEREAKDDLEKDGGEGKGIERTEEFQGIQKTFFIISMRICRIAVRS